MDGGQGIGGQPNNIGRTSDMDVLSIVSIDKVL